MLIIYMIIAVVIILILMELWISYSVHKDMTEQERLPTVESNFETFKELFEKYENHFEYYPRWETSLFVYNEHLFPETEIHASRYIFNGEAHKFGFRDYLKVKGYVKDYINNNKEELLNREGKLLR